MSRAPHPSQPRVNPKPNPQERGFVLVIALAGMLAITAAIAVQYNTTGAQKLFQVRQEENIRARGLAERCLNKAFAVAMAQLSAASDFDGLLDPNVGVDDEFIPDDNITGFGAGAVVYVPRDADGMGGNVRANHRFLLKRIGLGGCLVRFDDNQDETGVAQDFLDDTDRLITVTSIGIYPYLDSVAPMDAYGVAHARVTMKRLMGTGAAGNRAVAGGDDIEVGTGVEVCGATAGMAINEDATYHNTMCACGLVNSDPLPNNTTGCCGGACPTNNIPVQSSTPEPPPPDVTSVLAWNDDRHLELAGSAGPATNAACEFYIQDKDAEDPDSAGNAYRDRANWAGVEAMIYVFDRSIAGCDDTSLDNAGTIRRPCDYAQGDGTFLPCTAAESQCWYPLARFTAPADTVTLTGGATLDAVATGGGIAGMAATAVTLNRACHATNDYCDGVGSCMGVNPLFRLNGAGNNSVELQPSAANEAPTSSIMIWELEASAPTIQDVQDNVAYINAPGVEIKATHLVRGKLFAVDSSDLVCADCNAGLGCPNNDHRNQPALGRSRTPVITATEACYFGVESDVRGDVVCGSIHHGGGSSGVAKSCSSGNLTATYTGTDYDGASADIFNPGAPVDCNFSYAGYDCGDLGICLGSFIDHIGRVRSLQDLCIGDGAGNPNRNQIQGVLHSGNDLVIRQRTNINGQVIAGDDLGIHQNVEIRFDDPADDWVEGDVLTVAGATGSAGWMEATW